MFSNILTIARRSILQLARDRRTIALILVVPLVVASLIGVSIPDKATLNYTLPAMLATLILFFGFLLSGISFLRERSQGTRERLMASPVSRLDIVAGYLLGFLLFAMLQTLILFFYSVYVLKVDFHGSLWQILVFQMLIGILAVCLGIFISAFAKNEFQMVQFIPLIIVPQVFVCGLLFPISQQPEYLQWIARFLPLTYGVEGIKALMLEGKSLLDILKDVAVLAGYSIVLMGLAGVSLRRGKTA
ncbi:MAG TPA: ABC transporter permease [Dehalococcoidales bacterium]|nr:ABC transporter permease [Dehalococcoidales bacterium]